MRPDLRQCHSGIRGNSSFQFLFLPSGTPPRKQVLQCYIRGFPKECANLSVTRSVTVTVQLPFPPFYGHPLQEFFSFTCSDVRSPQVIGSPESCGACSGC